MLEPELFQKAIRMVIEDPRVDVGGFFYNLEMPSPGSTEKIIETYHQVKKPMVVFTWPTGVDFAVESKKTLIQAGVPVIEHIPSGLWAIAALADWVKQAEQRQPFPAYIPDQGRQKALEIIRRAQSEQRRALTESQSKRVLAAYGILVTREKLARSAAEAVQYAAEIGYPVALKIESPQILHKTEAGGVALNLPDEAAVASAYEQILQRARSYNPDAVIDGVLVQEMLSPGLEVIIGLKSDPVFGPAVLFGLGGSCGVGAMRGRP